MHIERRTGDCSTSALLVSQLIESSSLVISRTLKHHSHATDFDLRGDPRSRLGKRATALSLATTSTIQTDLKIISFRVDRCFFCTAPHELGSSQGHTEIHRGPGLLGIDRCQGLFHDEASMKQGSRTLCCYKLLATSTVRPEWCFAPVFASAAYGMVRVLLSFSHINLLDGPTQHLATSGCSVQPPS